jgi:hypothetical protein
MAHFDIVLASASALLVKRPHCLQCGGPMTLVRLSPLVPHMMQRTFECPTCDRAKTRQRDHPDPLAALEAAAKRKRA